MLNVKKLKKGDKIAIVSLSSGVLGEPFVAHEYYLGIKNLRELGLEPVFMANSLKGIDFIKDNPKARLDDLKQAFLDKEIKAILCAIGGNDAYLVTKYALEDDEFKEIIKNNPKIFIGYSDATTNHLLLNSLGLQTFYGMTFLSDFAEMYKGVLPYTENSFKTLFNNMINVYVEPSDVWYYERKKFDACELGKPRVQCENAGYVLLNGSGKTSGILYGGCVELLYREVLMYCNDPLYNGYCSAILDKNMFNNSVVLLEVSELKPEPAEFRKMLKKLIDFGMFENCNAVLFGKPQDEVYMQEYHDILKEELTKYNVLILANVNIGHSQPHAILPLGAKVEVDAEAKTIQIKEEVLF